jgi:hypothetical protein
MLRVDNGIHWQYRREKEKEKDKDIGNEAFNLVTGQPRHSSSPSLGSVMRFLGRLRAPTSLLSMSLFAMHMARSRCKIGRTKLSIPVLLKSYSKVLAACCAWLGASLGGFSGQTRHAPPRSLEKIFQGRDPTTRHLTDEEQENIPACWKGHTNNSRSRRWETYRLACCRLLAWCNCW